jgi:hypothetical protein
VRKARTKEFSSSYPKEIGSFIQLEDRIIEIVTSKLARSPF